MSNKEQIRIIAVRPLKGCAPHIRKILKEDETYFFYNDYDVDPTNNELIRKKKCAEYSTIPTDFFSTDKTDSPLISISAIVGKNGDGKSSIIELLMRVLNNFAYSSGYRIAQNNYLFAAKEVRAKVYYSIKDKLYVIENVGNIINLISEDKGLLANFDIKAPEKNIVKLKEIEPFLFYTQISNYSLYAYNTNDFHKENTRKNENWLNGIFHKNDGYQTPIVLNPWRDEGVIDINKENGLAKQRLTSLFVEDKSFREINKKQNAKSLILRTSESKLENKTFYKFFKETLTIDNSLKIENELNLKKLPLIIKNKKKDLTNHDSIKKINDSINHIEKIVTNNEQLFEKAINIKNKLISDIREDTKDDTWSPLQSDIAISFDSINDCFKQSKIINGYHFNEKTSTIIQKLNSSQFMRVILASAFRGIWLEMYPNNKSTDYDVDELIYDYLAYKSISIIEKYHKYKELTENFNFTDFISNNDYFDTIKNNCKLVIQSIIDDSSHISLKIRQTINFIKFNNSYKYIDFEKDFEKKAKNTGTKKEANCIGIIKLDAYKKKIEDISKTEGNIKTLDLLPPSIFNVDILIDNTGKKKDSLLSALSSGERQELNSISSIIYHLQNINSVEKEESTIKYKHINLIFEEVELYFHPEYQQKYIKRLISQIEKSKLNNIDSINICFVTHSPFILSDIPTNNILKLEDGKPIYEIEFNKVKEQTFSENIHELLANKFFLNESFMGEFARQKIQSLIKYLTEDEDKDNFYRWDRDKAKQTIEIIAEVILKERLQSLYDEKYHFTDQEYIEERIKVLESKLTK